MMAGRGGGIRTPDPLLPKQMRYQAALRPDIHSIVSRIDLSLELGARLAGPNPPPEEPSHRPHHQRHLRGNSRCQGRRDQQKRCSFAPWARAWQPKAA